MEEKPAGGGGEAVGGGSDSPASAEPGGSSRRRAGGQKRKSSSLASSSPLSSTPSKRVTRDKAAVPMHSTLHHNGPLTRAARQSPGNLTSSTAKATGKSEDKVVAAVAAALEEEERKLEELELAIEAEFEAIRSRDSNLHVVPNHCGWFSWTKAHFIEERSIPSFFNGKSETRTQDIYLKIRNSIMKRFRTNPSVLIESKDLNDLEEGELDARQEVLEFLDHWGLINFHPFPKIETVAGDDGGVDEMEKKHPLLEKLFRFEAIQTAPAMVASKLSVTSPAAASRLLMESAVAEELAKAEGPAVEYHCNSCSADCSRKRYHCQKQADYDLCADCFNNGKFDSDMSSSDFILMEPAESHGISGGKWTDQETLLLLEALEIFEDNWSEIAEHVATKTKAQCISHFLQMPIEDPFVDCNDDIDANPKEITEPAAAVDYLSAPKDVSGSAEDNASGAKGDKPVTSEMEATKPENDSESKVCQETAIPDNGGELITSKETLKPEDASKLKAVQSSSENLAVKALTEAFDAIGYLPTPGSRLSFADVGNPVMALAGFLARLVESDVATASARYSLKSLSCSSPGLQLAARHCFLLEDPPDDRKDPVVPICIATGIADQDEKQKGSKSTTILDDRDMSGNHSDKKVENPFLTDEIPADSSNNNSTKKASSVKEAGLAVTHKDTEPCEMMESSDSELPKDHSLGIVNEIDKSPSKGTVSSSNPVKAPEEGSSTGQQFQDSETVKDVDLVTNQSPPEKNGPSQSIMPVEDPSKTAEALKEVDAVPDSLPSEKNELQHHIKSELVGDGKIQPDRQNSVIDNEATAAENQKVSKKQQFSCEGIKEDDFISTLKRAASSALSAAAVKAKLLVNQEEDQIRQLATSLIEKQLHKLEIKLAFLNDMDNVITKVRELLERSRQRLYHERAQIIATRLGLPASSSRAMQPSLPGSRIAMNLANSAPRPLMGMIAQRPPIPTPMGVLVPTTSSSQFLSTNIAGTSIRPSGQEKLSSVGPK